MASQFPTQTMVCINCGTWVKVGAGVISKHKKSDKRTPCSSSGASKDHARYPSKKEVLARHEAAAIADSIC